MMNKELKVGDVVFIREDLVQYTIYDNQSWNNAMKTGKVAISYVGHNWFNITTDTENERESFYTYTPEMIDWDKTNEYRKTINKAEVGEIVIDWKNPKENKNVDESPLDELENGDIVYIRDDLENERQYGSHRFMKRYMLVGAQKVRGVNLELNIITLDDYTYFYTPEMIDWVKTRDLNHPRAQKKDSDITINDIWQYANKLYEKGLIFELRRELHDDIEYISWNNKRRDDGYVNSNEDLDVAIDKLKQLEKETFTILTEEDINRVTARESVGFDSESMSVAKLKNGNEILITREVGDNVASGIAVYMRQGLYKNYLDLEVLEGAVVTQDALLEDKNN